MDFGFLEEDLGLKHWRAGGAAWSGGAAAAAAAAVDGRAAEIEAFRFLRQQNYDTQRVY